MIQILMPTDFSENSFSAMHYAQELFKNIECTFHILHTYTPAFYHSKYVLQSPAQYGISDTYQNMAITQVEQAEKRLKAYQKNSKHHFKTYTAFNLLTDEINDIGKKQNIDLIVMGTQGATGAKEIFLGTHTVHVMKRAQIPLLAVPPSFQYEVPKEILFPTDYEVDFTKKRLDILLAIAKEHLSSIEVMHVKRGYELRQSQKRNQENLTQLLTGIAHLFHEWPDQEVIQAVNAFQLKHKTQLLVMVRNKHSFIERLFIEPVIKKISFHLTIPFLVIPFQNK